MKFTRLVGIDELVETIARMAQLEKHVCILDVIADLVLDDSGTVYESWITCQWRLQVTFSNNKPIRADR